MNADRKLLILDLDETLIFATEHMLHREPDFEFDEYYVYLRPFARQFVAFCRDHFKVAVWTSASEDYAERIVAQLFGADFPLEFLWARGRCTRVFNPELMDHDWVKDLGKVKRRGYDLDQVIMVDDTPRKLMRNYGNLVRVTMFEGQADDRELELLRSYLTDLKMQDNIRSVEKRHWRVRYS